jgi:hypothetical protein
MTILRLQGTSGGRSIFDKVKPIFAHVENPYARPVKSINTNVQHLYATSRQQLLHLKPEAVRNHPGLPQEPQQRPCHRA